MKRFKLPMGIATLDSRASRRTCRDSYGTFLQVSMTAESFRSGCGVVEGAKLPGCPSKVSRTLLLEKLDRPPSNAVTKSDRLTYSRGLSFVCTEWRQGGCTVIWPG